MSFPLSLPGPPRGTPYQLRSVVEHRGEAGGGHYVAFVRAHGDRWYICDDASARPEAVGVQTVLASEAYLLFYEA